MGISVIIPVRNGGEDFKKCLEALNKSSYAPDEIIVVDDGSDDSSSIESRQAGLRVISLHGKPLGPAAARNRGAKEAQGDILVFIDADVAVHVNTLELIQQTMGEHLEIAALFGSYDDSPAKTGLVSRYKNLQHHYVHQNGKREAGTFWAGCGAIRRDVFAKMEGFNVNYNRPSIEDIDLGLRLRRAGYRIWLCPEIQACHLKQWHFVSWLHSDIFDRAIPWTKLILSTDNLPSDLNLNGRSRFSAIAVWTFLVGFMAGFFHPVFWLVSLVSLACLAWMNFDFYRLLTRKGGLLFGIGSFPLHALYYLYSSLIFGSLSLWHLFQVKGRRLAAIFQAANSR